ncbi:MAG: ATP-binding cassette domain-containing protein [Clostridiales bacterium]|nr:ATP-binding cassette domain-containing protein [Clostridiales bacterium]MCF8022331.1 ATP-binding cassette domain-containing protein [Clostridiales bacterium]
MIELDGVTKYFFPGTVNEVKALDNINFKAQDGDFITIIGSNGAGKSTFLKAISGVISVDSGSIKLEGLDMTGFPEHKRAQQIGRIDQDPMASTAGEMTIKENLAMAYMRGKKRRLSHAVNKKRTENFAEVLKDLGLGLESRLEVPVETLSGGQRQAMALLMATIARPKLLLLDEHTAALDPKAARLVMKITRRLVESHGLTTLMITHNMEQALKYGNRLIMMHRGKIILDIGAEEKKDLTVSDLIDKFTATSGSAFDDDRVLLA